MMLMEVLQNLIQFFDGGHTGFGLIIVMLRILSNVHLDVILEKTGVVHFIIGDLDTVTWEISIVQPIVWLVAMMKTQSIIFGKILVRIYLLIGICWS